MKNRSQRAFTLVEFIIVITLLMLLAVITVSALNPGLLPERGRDAQRKKDVGRIRIAFEEYFNDKGCFPTQATIDAIECDKNGFQPWLSIWPCDPIGQKYYIFTSSAACPTSYRILTNLRNKTDKQIPIDWYSQSSSFKYGDGSLTINDVNYGASSQNILWSLESVPAYCYTSFTGCFTSPGPGTCNALPGGADELNSFVNEDCLPDCMVSCCNSGRICVSQ